MRKARLDPSVYDFPTIFAAGANNLRPFGGDHYPGIAIEPDRSEVGDEDGTNSELAPSTQVEPQLVALPAAVDPRAPICSGNTTSITEQQDDPNLVSDDLMLFEEGLPILPALEPSSSSPTISNQRFALPTGDNTKS